MSIGLCRQTRDSKLIRVSLISATMDGMVVGPEDVDRISGEMSARFGYSMEHELRALDEYRPAEKSDLRHVRQWMVREGKVWARVWRQEGEGRSDFIISGPARCRSKLDWAFIHRKGEEPVSRKLPDGKSAWVFLRNGSEGCIPCTFNCGGCGRGSLRLAVSGLSPYGIDSEVVAEAALECVHSALEATSRVEYTKKGLAWGGYTPRQVAHFSGPWFNLALMDYFHRFSGVLTDFTYPFAQPSADLRARGPDTGSRMLPRRRWFPPWRTNR
jgi:hypothetical protein